jgi:large repetitive protein
MCRLSSLVFSILFLIFVVDGLSAPVRSNYFPFDNLPPVITGHRILTTPEDTPVTITLADLTVSDSDNTYPDDFTLIVNEGANYSVSGAIVTPDLDFDDSLKVSVAVSDGVSTSQVYLLPIDVTPVNDPPIISGQNAVTTAEDQPVTITLADLIVNDVDNTYPDDFTLSVSAGSNYTVSGTTVTPSTGYNGELTVPVTVNDGVNTSNSFDLKITVSLINDKPVIVSQAAVQTPEETAITISLNDLTVSDADNLYPSDFTLQVSDGSNYTAAGASITPAANFNGILSVPITVSDGTSTSDIFDFKITVTPVNDPPEITGHTGLSTAEDQPITLSFTDLHVTDPDNSYPAEFTMSISSGTNYTVSGQTITPTTDYVGALSVPVMVNDGTTNSNTFDVQISVGGSNDAPVITGQVALTTPEETPITISLDNLTVSDPDNNYPADFTLTIGSGENYSVSGNTVTPVENYTGTLTVPVIVNDGQSSSGQFNLQISVVPLNDNPVITGQASLATNEDESITLALENLTVADADNTYPTGFSMSISPGENYTVNGFAITPDPNYSGNLIVPVTVNDGANESPVYNLTITVNPVNDVPLITGQQPVSTPEETPVAITLSHLIVTDPDNSYPDDFTLAVSPGTNYTLDGNSVTPAQDFTGTLSVPVTVSDGVNTSAQFNLQIPIQGANDAPVITGQIELDVNEEQPLEISLSHIMVTDSDNTYPEGFSILLQQGSNYTLAGTTITPVKDYNGILSVPVQVSDGGSLSNILQLQVTVNPVNDPPQITGQQPISTYKNKSVAIDFSNLIVTDPDNTYPQNFTISLQEGPNHTVAGTLVTPKADFIGPLNVPVTVTDGLSPSAVYAIRVDVVTPPNVVPVITGQVSLSTFKNQPLTLQLTHLVVSDPDNVFPADFKMTIFPGNNYSVNGNQIVPLNNFSGTLTVPVAVSDKESTSATFNITIPVVPVSERPLITSQQFLRVDEESSLTLALSNVTVVDNDNTYPNGFSMRANAGSNYILNGLTVTPAKDFNGYIEVPVTVSDGTNTSPVYSLLILVDPVNDAPVVTDTEPGIITYSRSSGSLKLFEKFEVRDVDDDTLSLAEINFKSSFSAGYDSLGYTNTHALRGFFDKNQGTLVVVGQSSVEEYQQFIRNITYNFNDDIFPEQDRILSILLSDGRDPSNIVEKTITFGEGSAQLEIPKGFTPNGDGANDTWTILPAQGNADYTRAVVKVYDRKGVLVYEARGLDQGWDGRMNGNLLPAGVYFYTIDLNAAYGRNRYQGVVTLLR